MEFLTLAPGSDRIPVELFQILKDDAVESAALNMQYAFNMQYAGSRQCPTLCDPRDGSPPGSPVPGILQARTLNDPQILSSEFKIYMYVITANLTLKH